MAAVSREVWLALFGALFLLGVAATAERILRARRHGYSVRLQIFVPLAATTLALSGSFAAIVIDRTQSRAEIFARRAAEDEAKVVAALLRRNLSTSGATLEAASREVVASGALQAFSRDVADTQVVVLDPQGRVMASVGSVREASVLLGRVGSAVVEAAVAISPTHGTVRVRKGTSGMAQLLSDVAPKVALLALIFAVASAVVAALLGSAVAGPIERLTRAAERVARGERQAVLPEPRGREVRALTHALESMRRELEQRHALEAFVADLSHELKNPIAAIRAAAEVLEEGAADRPETALKFAARIRESAAKLQSLTQDLLALARLEARGLEDQRELVELEPILRWLVEAHRAEAASVGVRLECAVKAPARTRGNPLWLRRALDNLLANALQHTPAGGRVLLTLEERGTLARVAVQDQGRGVDPAILDRLFQRFTTTRHGQGGTGLGLAIVRAVAELHGGRAALAANGPGGATFELELPRA
jgi:two-component system sensor histidine kinase CreC